MTRLFIFSIFLLSTAIGAEPLLRLSKVADRPGKGICEYTYKSIDSEGNMTTEKLLLYNEIILTEKDVKSASIDTTRKGTINVELNKKGATKLRNATEKFRLGKDRIAMLVDRKVKIAPTVQAVISKRFEISGLHDMEPDELRALVDRLNSRRKKHEPEEGEKNNQPLLLHRE